MRKYFILLILLAACAQDNYVPKAGTEATEASESADLKVCKHQVVKQYYDSKPDMDAVGVVASGALGGALGGLVFGSAVGAGEESDPSTIHIKDINAMVTKCMNDKGYVGSSH